MNHFSLAFTYDWIASEREQRSGGGIAFTFGETIASRARLQFRHETGVDWHDRRRTVF